MTSKQDHPKTAIEKFLRETEAKTLLRFVTAGSVDDGKSTLIGRLLHDSKNVYEDTLASLKTASQKQSKEGKLDFSLVTDGLKAEREQKITIDVAYRYFSTPKRNFILADSPGHEQYTRNMATGASTANAAILLIDATKGISVQTKRHSFILNLLGIRHFLVAINKMDLVDYSQEVFEEIVKEYKTFAQRLEVPDIRFVPVSALEGENISTPSEAMPWFRGESVLEYLENLYADRDTNFIDFRMPIQSAVRPHQDFRGVCGQIVSGIIRPGEAVMVLPSMKQTRVKSIVTYDGEIQKAFAPMSVTLTFTDEVDMSRGDVLAPVNNLPRRESELEAMLVWMAEKPMNANGMYLLKHMTSECKASISDLRYQVDVNTLSRKEASDLSMNEIGRVRIQTSQPVFSDPYRRNPGTGSFILVDAQTYNTVAAGMVLDRIPADKAFENLRGSWPKGKTKSQNIRKEPGKITRQMRQEKLGQKAVTIWLTGLSGSGKSTIAANLEQRLFDSDILSYRLDGDNIRFGLSQDLGFSSNDRKENIRRIAEVAKLMNEAGLVVITSFISPFAEDRAAAKEIIGEDSYLEVFVDAPLDICEQRDVKGLYKKARAGEIANFTGVSSPYEAPKQPDLRLDTQNLSATECVELIYKQIKSLG